MHRTAALLIGCLLVSVSASAGPINGSGLIEGKDAGDRRLLIDGTVYVVSPEAQLLWEDGRTFTMTSLPAAQIDAPGGLWPLLRADYEGRDGTSRNDPDLLERVVIRTSSE